MIWWTEMASLDNLVKRSGLYYEKITDIPFSGQVEGVFIGAAVGSGLGLVAGVKNAYDGFKEDTAGYSS